MFGQNGVIIETEVKFTCPPPGFHNDDLLSAIYRHKGHAYFIWTDKDCRPFVTKVSDTTNDTETAPLDPNPDYKAHADGHHRYSLGVDKDGYIHVAGDMHNHTAWANPMYIERYRNTHIMYWVSKAPESLVFEFKGKERVMPGCGWTYGRFFSDRKGELFHAARVKAIDGGHSSGEIGYGLYRYDTATKKWSVIGGMPDNIKKGDYYPVLFWENGGFAGKTDTDPAWYQGLLNKINFDHNNRLHVACGINSDPTLKGNNVLLYAYSDDLKTWHKADGSKIAGLPLRAVAHPNQADVVATTTTDMFDSKISVAVNHVGAPSVIAGGYSPSWYSWVGGKWQKDALEYRMANCPAANSALNAEDGAAILTVTPIGVLLHAKTFDKIAYGYEPFGYSELQSLTVPDKGVVYAVGRTEAKIEQLLKITARKAPLPSDLTSVDITKPGYAGYAGYEKGKLVIGSFGTSITDQSDSCHFVYARLSGDGFLEAKVDVKNVSDHGRAGLMIRESLDPRSRSVFFGHLPGKPKPLWLTVRKELGAWASNEEHADKVNWLRLERKGSAVTFLVSEDGKTWRAINTTTMSMASDVLIGFAAASYHRYGMQTASFEAVKYGKQQAEPPKEKSVTLTPAQFDALAAELKGKLFV